MTRFLRRARAIAVVGLVVTLAGGGAGGCASGAGATASAPSARDVRSAIAFRHAIEEAASPWRDAASALSLVRDSGEARALVPYAFEASGGTADGPWQARYQLDPVAIRSEADRVDAGILRVAERITRGRGFVERSLEVEGLAAGRTVLVDVPLRDDAGRDGGRSEERFEIFINGARVDPPLGAAHTSIELSRDEATVIRLVVASVPEPR